MPAVCTILYNHHAQHTPDVAPHLLAHDNGNVESANLRGRYCWPQTLLCRNHHDGGPIYCHLDFRCNSGTAFCQGDGTQWLLTKSSVNVEWQDLAPVIDRLLLYILGSCCTYLDLVVHTWTLLCIFATLLHGISTYPTMWRP